VTRGKVVEVFKSAMNKAAMVRYSEQSRDMEADEIRRCSKCQKCKPNGLHAINNQCYEKGAFSSKLVC
jgi:hypothetical protein